MHKDSKDLKCDKKTTLSACADAVGCEWNEGQCATFGFKTLQHVIKADDGSSFHAMYEAATTCAMKKKSGCDGGCEWDAEKGICDVGQTFVDAVCENDHALKLIQLGTECSKHKSESCKENCEWNKEEQKCDIEGNLFMKHAYGENSAKRISDTIDQTLKCTNAIGACQSPCDNKVGVCTLPLEAEMASIYDKSIVCRRNIGESTCNSKADCQWEENECNVSRNILNGICGTSSASMHNLVIITFLFSMLLHF